MIGRLEKVVLDSRDPHRLARFYAELLGAKITSESAEWVTLDDEAGHGLAFQTAPEYVPPRFPDPAGSQQLHLEVRVDDVDDAERKVLELGATRVHDAVGENGFRVFRDPDGHPFCLVFD
jgi:catechol 2,3-dioxygenase-like lactoylglutathione lyase family enzyme